MSNDSDSRSSGTGSEAITASAATDCLHLSRRQHRSDEKSGYENFLSV